MKKCSFSASLHVLLCVLFTALLTKNAHSQEEPYFCANVMSYNILNTIYEPASNPWSIRKQLVVDLITEVSPDLIGFQEDSVEQVEFLETALPSFNVVKAPISIASQENTYHAIFYDSQKFSLVSNGSFSEVNRARRNANWVKLVENKSGAMLFVINGHFLIPAEPEVRLSAAIQYATQIALFNTEQAPIVMLGDLNSLLDSPPILYLTSEAGTFPDLQYPAGFRRLYTPSSWDRNLNYLSSLEDIPITSTIDYILTSGDLRYSNPEKISYRGSFDDVYYYHSDHHAIAERVCHGSPAHLLVPVTNYILDD